MKEKLKSFIRSLGFDEVGISHPVPATWNHYAHWLNQGYHGEMYYLKNRLEERKNLESIVQNPGSIIMVSKRYLTVERSSDSLFQGIVSRYAWGDDYHTLIREKLNYVCRWIENETHEKHGARACVDTAPILERDFAAQSGIGWFGKHTNLLSRSLGNWFFLGAVVTTMELPPDSPVSPHCGTCSRCLDICPTNAFVAPYVLDARRCISYLTIELKGYIPLDLRPLIGRRIFGCDDCLEICPWNKFAVPTGEKTFLPRTYLHDADLIELMGIDEEEFQFRFKESPIKRVKRRGFLRNVAVALGNAGNEKAISVLSKAIYDGEPLIRGHSAWALGRIGGKQSIRILKQALLDENDGKVQEEIIHALKKGENEINR